ncbi:hypothetical protein [Methanofollis fontis]|uniref:Uncharacterized protein n=1 Tax=Methanofollis fontis TaxID=2052832 RepID=A0A483CZ45_9EURY|nr:hypothetical protein [Methanofollis fontis]TAJ45572.1 hypothetical protein CUJ86_02280 [Methanofollis fontis]
MRSRYLVLSLALVAALLLAGCTGTPSGEETTATPTAVLTTAEPTTTEPAEEPAGTLTPAITLGTMHATMMEAIEEALAYPVLNATEEKSDFEAKVAEFDVLAARFTEEAALDSPENAETKEAFDAILVKKAAVVDAAGDFFAAYEVDRVVRTENVTVFEESIDVFTSAFGPFTKAYFEGVSEAEFGDDDHARSALALLTMHRDLLEGVEEAFGYVLLNDTAEKEDFWQKMQDFDTAGNAFVESGYLDRPENSAKLAAYTAMMHEKEQMQGAASAMFDEFEATGTVSANVAGAFEKSVDALTTAYDALLDEVLADL